MKAFALLVLGLLVLGGCTAAESSEPTVDAPDAVEPADFNAQDYGIIDSSDDVEIGEVI